MADKPPKDRKEPARTVFESSTPPLAPKAKRKAAAGAATLVHSKPPKPAVTPSSFAALSSPGAKGRIEIGSVLNHIYEVTRFIGRGGMGEVYEGINVNTDERVAIKVILPHLAQDPNVQAMFRKEARTLTRLSHPALVQYRVLAVEPQLGVLYIVTEFIDGVGVDELLGELKPNDDELLALTKRLAEGLRVAHDLGAIHRDISPDNILLPGGKLETAVIIDFGIAKDLDSTQATIVGDGFAGKLGFVAPEQFGDFGREIGPWTDVYSLGLVMLSIAAGKPVNMGATLVEAVDRRRAGPDLTALSPELQPLFSHMLAADPKVRLRSMDELLQEIAALRASLRAAPEPEPEETFAAPPPEPVAGTPSDLSLAMDVPEGVQPPRKSPLPLIIGGGLALAAVAAGAVFMLSRPAKAPAATPEATIATQPEAAPVTPATTAPAAAAAPVPAVITAPPPMKAALRPAQSAPAPRQRAVAARPAPRPAPVHTAAPAPPKAKAAPKDCGPGCY